MRLGTRRFFAFGLCALVFSLKAMALSGTDLLTEKSVTLEAAPNIKATVVVFLSANCPCSQGHEERLKTLAGQFKSFRFIGVHSNFDEDLQIAHTHFKQANFPFPVIKDHDQIWANHFGALKTPHVFILNPQGSIVFEGGVDNSKLSIHADKHFLAEALLALDKGETPKQKTVRTLGCAIRRK